MEFWANLPLQMEIAHQKEPQATFHPLGIAFPSQLELIPAHDCVLLSRKVVRNIPPFALFSFRAAEKVQNKVARPALPPFFIELKVGKHKFYLSGILEHHLARSVFALWE